MPLLRVDNLSLAFGHHSLLDKVNFQLDAGERVCLLGRNGTGKSSLFQILSGDLKPDDGVFWLQPGVSVARLQQDVPGSEDQTVFDVVAQGLGDVAELLNQYHALIVKMDHGASEADVNRLASLQQQIEDKNAWQFQQRIETAIANLQLDADATLETLSGGWRRRVFLAQALVNSPDVLLLDEPTNHLDIAAIQWLEQFLLTQRITLMFITHDRAFLQRLATRILDLDRGKLTSWSCDYQTYLARKAHLREVEADQNSQFDKHLSDEEKWVRQGVKARRTRNEGRVRRLQALREQRGKRREEVGKVTLNVVTGQASGNLVFEADNIHFAYQNNVVLAGFSTCLMRGEKVGLVGPNGVGKSTLLQLLLGDIVPDSGRVTQGTRLQVAYFDQQHAVLDPEQTVIDTVNDGNEFVTIDGKQRHVVGYLQDFLFEPERLRSPVKTLSGGESNRLLLARLFAKPANVLVLDEPTNDLDIETLELLESLLVDYQGTVLLVSHDRAFLDNVVSSVLAFEGNGIVNEYVGGYDDYIRQRQTVTPSASTAKQSKNVDGIASQRSAPQKKHSYKVQKELDELPVLIERLETEQAEVQQVMAASDFYQENDELIRNTTQRLAEISQELTVKYSRWEELENPVK